MKYVGSAILAIVLIALIVTASAALAGPGVVTRLDDDNDTASPRRTSVSALLGDANDDCVVDVVDLTLTLAYGSDADFNGDGVVDQIDVEMVQALWGGSCGKKLLGDVNGSGRVDTTDLSELLGYWNTDHPQTDLNGDGTTDDIDRDMLLANWGATFGRRTLGDHTGDDRVDVRDLSYVLANWDKQTSQLELDLVLAMWDWTSGRDLTGDVDGNEHVDIVDQELVLATWGTSWPPADLDDDGTVGVQDLVIVQGNFGNVSGIALTGDVDGNWITDAVDLALLQAVWGTDWVQADLNADGTVDIQDLLLLNASFGRAYGLELAGDINGDCTVDEVDQKIVLAVWGAEFTQADLNTDGSISVEDLIIILGNWDEACP